MKIYTKRGDQGDTDLFGAGRVAKDDLRVEAYGTVDECNAQLGLVRALLSTTNSTTNNVAHLSAVDAVLERLQNEMFELGSELAAPGMADKLPRVSIEDIEALEQEIDAAETQLPPLKRFILPGGTGAGAMLHVARTVARRAERLVVQLARESQGSAFPLRGEVVKYLNRLSDHLFVYARLVNHLSGQIETEWQGRTKTL